jgi:hypothetical protein
MLQILVLLEDHLLVEQGEVVLVELLAVRVLRVLVVKVGEAVLLLLLGVLVQVRLAVNPLAVAVAVALHETQ